MTKLKNPYSNTYAKTWRAAIDLSLSENPLGPSPKVIEALLGASGRLHLYPDQENALITLISRHHNVAENSILLGAGANQLLEDYLKVYAINKNIVVPAATFPESVACMATLQGSVTKVPLQSDFSVDPDALLKACQPDTAFIHICNPNNPTGIWIEPCRLLQLAVSSPAPLLISEAGADFVGQTMISQSLHNIIVVRSFSKGYGLAGLRIGYSIALPEIISTMKRNLRSYRVSSLAIAAAIAAIQDQDHLKKTKAYFLQEKAWLMEEMNILGYKIIPSHGQTFIAKVPEKFNSAEHFCATAKQYGVAVVNCTIYLGLDEYIRISPQKHDVNKKFLLILKRIKEGK